MLDRSIPFEFHLTTIDLPLSRQTEFIHFCSANGAKALTIELARGEHLKQPMLTQEIIANDLNFVFFVATELSNLLTAQNFPIARLKIEIPSSHSELFQDSVSTFERYFEWHGKIDYTQVEKLHFLCESHQVHLSRNSLAGEPKTRFITLREFGSKSQFENRIAALLGELQSGGWSLLKQISEYCVYDNNKFLDNGWLPQ
ncbi:hypothetical protein [Oscillatoria sp. FACHB-1406]|uniref:hypothetical protein n=1 Tax=Oscillatoria sp. FACHB-1406 TaxID=2692846 RepID=UPI001685CB67|nr:hypothetical protein [Oscillatoria sp. FACHB-1406]MBD2576683.1 hypothetical protein [Oscillatoria sp. FACHB-1406]